MGSVKTVNFGNFRRRYQVAYSIDGDLARQIEVEAQRRGVAPADLSGEILTAIVPGWVACSVAQRLANGNKTASHRPKGQQQPDQRKENIHNRQKTTAERQANDAYSRQQDSQQPKGRQDDTCTKPSEAT